jgi:hypothetical protein
MIQALHLFLLLIISIGLQGQGVIGVVEYLNVKNQIAFLEVEKELHPVYRVLIDQKKIVGCSVYQVLKTDSASNYNYIKILWFDAFSKINRQLDSDSYLKAYPQSSKEAWRNLQARMWGAATVYSSGVFQQQLSCTGQLDEEGQYYRIREVSIKPDSKKRYLQLLEEVYLPIYREDMKRRNRTVWSLWANWTGSLENYDYTIADGFVDLEELDEQRYAELFYEIHPDKDLDRVRTEIKTIQVSQNVQVWKLIHRIL